LDFEYATVNILKLGGIMARIGSSLYCVGDVRRRIFLCALVPSWWGPSTPISTQRHKDARDCGHRFAH